MARVLISRIAFAAALPAGVIGSGVIGLAAVGLPAAALAKPSAPKAEFSPAYAKAAVDLDKTVRDGATNPAVKAASAKAQAATSPADKQAAAAEVDAALGGVAAKVQLARAAVSTPTDKLSLGQLIYTIGTYENDAAQQHEGLAMMLDSGGLPAAEVGKIQYAAGATSYQSGDYASAIKYLKPAYDSGYRDEANQIGALISDIYRRTNNPAAMLDMANKDLAASRAAGTKPAEVTIRTALQAAYDGKNLAAATDLSAELARNYPSPQSWNTAVDVVRALSALPQQDNLDLMRLMARTNALSKKQDYFEYLQNADPRRLPGETLKIVDMGVSSGKLTSAEVADYRQTASGRLAADKASLPALERDARSGSANANTITGAADAFLSYDQPAKAEELYKLALAKPGVDKDRALTRLGIAQSDQGKYADAQQSFAQVGGARGPMAKLWTAYMATKTGASTAPTSAAPASAAR